MNQLRQSKIAVSILIVEDDQETRAIISRVIAMRFPDAAIYLAENGIMGEEVFKKHTPEIVITDISMPLKNGIEMAREIKSIKAADTKIIVVTAHDDKINLAQFKEIGVHTYLFKPLNLDELMLAVGECIEEISVHL